MDLYCSDRKLSELGSNGFEDLLDQDMFTPPANSFSSEPAGFYASRAHDKALCEPYDMRVIHNRNPSLSLTSRDCHMEHFGLDDGMSMNQEWLENFFDDPVLNDRMMTDALQPQRVQSEHSYSLANDGSPLNLKVENKKDLDMDILNAAVNPNMTVTNTSTTTGIITSTEIKQEPTSPLHVETYQDVPLNMSVGAQGPTATLKITRTVTQAQTILKQPTIILATPPSLGHQQLTHMSMGHDRLVLPQVSVKVEAQHHDSASTSSSPEHTTMYDSIGLPPTPPSSSNCSDSEGSQSPQRSAPSSPIRHGHLSRTHMLASPYGRNSPSPTFSQPIFTSPIPTSGVLILSEEEKRTLVSEGYPIPNKLPLTKQEEKNLKKIRRKIKNKISAQESRRKKKEYLETLEKRVESFSQENTDLKKKVDHLENNNRSLLSQLQKLQSLVGKCRPSSPSTQTGTCLMVLVLFFAVFIGSWSPMSWSIGYSSLSALGSPGGAGVVKPLGADPNPIAPVGPAMGPEIQNPEVADPYATPNMKSRLLLSVREDSEEAFGPHIPFSYRDFFLRWFTSGLACPEDGAIQEADFAVSAPVPVVNNNADAALENAAGFHGDDGSLDILVNYTSQVMTAAINITAA